MARKKKTVAEAAPAEEQPFGDGAPPAVKYAFRCINCGRLETSAQAGECECPAACVVCGHGVKFNPTTGIKTHDHDNWEILADLDHDELHELGIPHECVEDHTPAPKSDEGRAPMHHAREVSEGLSSEDAGSRE